MKQSSSSSSSSSKHSEPNHLRTTPVINSLTDTDQTTYHLPKPNPKDHQQTENLINKLNSLIKLKLYKQQPKSSQPPILGTKQYHHLNLSLTLNHPVISNHSQTTHRSSPLTEPVQQLSITTACQETQSQSCRPILLRTQSSNSLVCKPVGLGSAQDLLRRALEDDRLERQLIGDSDLLIVRKDDEGMMLVMEDGEAKCATCGKVGINFPKCPRRKLEFCSRNCRVNCEDESKTQNVN
ncbi:hypothetical protein BY996DRAFT_6421516 [Phakopsora pachyrhizi]|nr:hypothetical protein BY996DRAFT_6421516 [Phakopsora pachyrhizi]